MKKQQNQVEKVVMELGYIGVSLGEDGRIFAILWEGDDDFWFYPVTRDQAAALETWNCGEAYEDDLLEILPELTKYEIELFMGYPE